MQSEKIKRSYHSDIKLQFASNELPSDVSRLIPRSTRHNWKNKNIASFWSPLLIAHQESNDVLVFRLKAQNELLRKQLKSLFTLVLLYQELSGLFSIKTDHILKTRKRIIQLLQQCQHNNFDKTIWRYLPFSFKQWNSCNNRKQCLQSLQGLCRKQNTQQLSIPEQQIIQSECANTKYCNWPLCSIYYQLLREKKINCCKSTFYKYCRLLNITRKQIKNPKKYQPLLASVPLKVLHQDITIFKTIDGVKHYIYVIRDNFSRVILACRTTTEYSSGFARQILESVLQKFELIDKSGSLITDDGPKNKGSLSKWLNESATQWKKIIAQVDIVQSNSMVEAVNKILKYRFLFVQPVMDTATLKKIIKQAVEDYNNTPNNQLHGLTPNEALNGAKPNKQYFKEQISSAKKDRMLTNQSFECNMACQI